MDKKREIYTKLENVKELVEILTKIKEKQDKINQLFDHYDNIDVKENKTFENWNNYLEDVIVKLDHVTI